MGKEGRIDKTYKARIAYKKEVIYKIDYRFVTKFMLIFCIAFYIFIRFAHDDFGIMFSLVLAYLSLFGRLCAFRLIVTVDGVVFVTAVVGGVVLVAHFYAVCIVADIAVVLPVSGFFLEAVDILFDVAGVLVFALVVLFDVFGTLLDVAGLLVVDSGVSAVVVGIPVDTVGQFLEDFAAVLRSLLKAVVVFASFSFPFSTKCKLSL